MSAEQIGIVFVVDPRKQIITCHRLMKNLFGSSSADLNYTVIMPTEKKEDLEACAVTISLFMLCGLIEEWILTMMWSHFISNEEEPLTIPLVQNFSEVAVA